MWEGITMLSAGDIIIILSMGRARTAQLVRVSVSHGSRTH